MIYQINLRGVKPFSINKAHYRSGKRTRENREWALEVHRQLSEDPAFHRFSKAAQKCNYFHVHLVFNMPNENFYTKKGKISRLSSDLTNIEKGLVDLIFDKRFNGRVESDFRISTLCIDDCLITRLISEKRGVSGEYSIDVTVQGF